MQIIGVLSTTVSQGDNPARGGMEIFNPPGYFISANANRDYPGDELSQPGLSVGMLFGGDDLPQDTGPYLKRE